MSIATHSDEHVCPARTCYLFIVGLELGNIVRLINKVESNSLNEKLNGLGLYTQDQLKTSSPATKNNFLSNECPQGKVINPKSGRCIKDKAFCLKTR